MPRAHRLKVAGGLFHLTRRCHNRAFLLRFARDRDAYRAKLRQKLKHFDVSLLDYCLTCNHVHHEIMGTRRRYRVLDLDRLCWRFGTTALRKGDPAESHCQKSDEARTVLDRRSGGGQSEVLEQVQPLILSRRETEIVEDPELDLWVLKETEIPTAPN